MPSTPSITDAVQHALERMHADVANSPTEWMLRVWGTWTDPASLCRVLELPAHSQAWRAWCAGPSHCLHITERQHILPFFRHAFPLGDPYGVFVALVAHKKKPTPFVKIASSSPTTYWEDLPTRIPTHKHYGTATHALLAAYGTAPFHVGQTAHEILANRAQD